MMIENKAHRAATVSILAIVIAALLAACATTDNTTVKIGGYHRVEVGTSR
jgi:outer membrane protein assembly factor BamE (lipoprotein component of BamABCDE complex)